MQDAVKKFVKTCFLNTHEKDINSEPPHGLALIDMPTGTGKTFNTIKLIEQFIRGETFLDVKKVFYLTPLKKNVDDAYNDLKKMFSDNPKLFEENCLRILANADCVIENLLEMDKNNVIPRDITKEQCYKNIIGQLRVYRAFDDKQDDKDGSIELIKQEVAKTIRNDLEPKFRATLKKWIETLGENKKTRLNNIKTSYQWLLKLYPSILTEYRKVYFMTVDKFCAQNDALISNNSRFINSSLSKGALVFVDEIDASKEFILRSQIDESVNKKIDLIKLFSTLTGTFAAGRKMPTEMFPPAKDGVYKHSSEYAFNRMLEVLKNTRDEYHLEYPFKLEKTDENERTFLFQDNAIHTISNLKRNKILKIEVNTRKRQNIIISSNDGDDFSNNFYSMIYGMDGALTFSARALILMSHNYLEYYNSSKKRPFDDLMEPDEAASTILSPIELDDSLQSGLQKMIVDGFSFRTRNRNKTFVDTDFYTDGFKYFDFIDDKSHDTITNISMCDLNETPEKFLLNLASNSMVVGISATATIESVIGNYNLSYLKKKMGKAFYEIPKEDKDRMFKNVKGKENFKDYKINIEKIEANFDEPDSICKAVFENADNRELLENKLRSFGQKDDEKLYIKNRYAKTLLAIRKFISDPSGKVLLILTNNNLRPRNSSEPFSWNNIRTLIDGMCQEIGFPKENIAIHTLFGSNFEKEKSAYVRDVQQGKRVLLFSSYPASGTGQNLQYSIVMGEDEKHEMKDIDSLYLERPTNIIVNIPKKPNENRSLSEEDLIKYCYQIESLRSNGEISPSGAIALIKLAFKSLINGSNKIKINKGESGYDTDSVNNSVVKILEQAVGRICRTNDTKKQNVTIYVDNEIYEKIHFDCVKGKIMNREFEELINESTKVLSEKEFVDKEAIQKSRIGEDRCERLNSKLNSWMKDTKNIWSEDDIREWKRIREWVLKHPTCKKEEAINSGYSNLYVDFPKEMEGQRVYYNAENNQWSISFEKNEQHKGIVSAENSKLSEFMKIGFLRDFFTKNGYATTFERNECILNPVAFTNLYKGALGEVVGLEILRHRFCLKLIEITDPEKFEKFDYCLERDNDIYFDFKNWHINNDSNGNFELEHISNKLKKVGGKKAYIVNVLAEESFPYHENETIYQVPSLFKKNPDNYSLEIDVDQGIKIMKSIERCMNHGINK